MIILPNPFETSASTGGPQRAPAAVAANTHETAGALGSRFVLDVDRFMTDIEPPPAFLSAPSPEYLRAADMIPMLAVLAGH